MVWIVSIHFLKEFQDTVAMDNFDNSQSRAVLRPHFPRPNHAPNQISTTNIHSYLKTKIDSFDNSLTIESSAQHT